MIFLYGILDICIYNYTNMYSSIFLISFLKIKQLKLIVSFSIFFDLLILHTKFIFLFINCLVYFIATKIKGKESSINHYIFSYLIILLVYSIIAYLIYRNIIFNLPGLLVTIFFLVLSYKK